HHVSRAAWAAAGLCAPSLHDALPILLAAARELADAGTTSSELVNDGILTETCDVAGTCDDNAKQFKGIFMRYLDDLDDTLDGHPDRKSTRLNSSHVKISYAVFCLKKK